MTSAFRRLQEKRRDGEEGFTLIELLVVIIIIGILAAIAIPVFLSQRNKARVASIKADLNSAAAAEEGYFTNGGTYVSGVASTALAADGFKVSPDNVVTVIATSAVSFCVAGTNTQVAGTTWYWNSAGGGLTTTVCP